MHACSPSPRRHLQRGVRLAFHQHPHATMKKMRWSWWMSPPPAATFIGCGRCVVCIAVSVALCMVLLDRLPLVSVVVELCCIGGECMQYRRRIGGDCMSYRRRYMSRRRRPHCATLYLHVLYPRYILATRNSQQASCKCSVEA